MIARTFTAGGVFSLLAAVATVHAADPTTAPAGDDAKYTEMVGKRADEAVGAAKIDDATKAEKAKTIVAAYYRDIRDMDAMRDAQLKDLKKGPEAKTIADAEQAKKVERVAALSMALSTDLTAEQVEAIKDKIVYNVRQVTYGAYLDEIPKLTDEQKKYIADQLLEAREVALTGGSSKEKHGWFDKAKGRINNYLAKQGYDMKAENAAWSARRRAAATQKQ